MVSRQIRSATFTDLLQIRSSLKKDGEAQRILLRHKALFLIEPLIPLFPFYKFQESLSRNRRTRILRVLERNIVIGYWGMNRLDPKKNSWEIFFCLPIDEEKVHVMMETLLEWSGVNEVYCLVFAEEPGSGLDSSFLSGMGFTPIFSYALYGATWNEGNSSPYQPLSLIRKRNNLDNPLVHHLYKMGLPSPLQRLYIEGDDSFSHTLVKDFVSISSSFLPLEFRKEEWILGDSCYLMDIHNQAQHRVSLLYDPSRGEPYIRDCITAFLRYLKEKKETQLVIEVNPQDTLMVKILTEEGLTFLGERRIWARYSFVDVQEKATLFGVQPTRVLEP